MAGIQDPIHQDETDQQWYFWDETWADRLGPFKTRKHAERNLIGYCLEFLSNYPPEQETRLKQKLAELDAELLGEV